MNRLVIALALMMTVLLGGILYELHGLNRRLDSTARAAREFVEGAAASTAARETPEQRIQRLEQRVRDINQASDDLRYVLDRTIAGAPAPKTTRK